MKLKLLVIFNLKTYQIIYIHEIDNIIHGIEKYDDNLIIV